MKDLLKYLIIVCIGLCLSVELYAQNGNGFAYSATVISAHFRQESLKIRSDAPFFNVLVVENKGVRREEVIVEINVPIGWSVIADETRTYLLNPGDSVLIPVRAATSKGVEGEIGYSIIAAINNRNNENITNAYCFVKIPRETNFQFRPLTRLSYFDQQTGKSELSFHLINNGNITELVYLSFTAPRDLFLENQRDYVLKMDLLVKAKSDTIVTLGVQYIGDQGIQDEVYKRIDLHGFTQDTEFSTSFWFSRLKSDYKFLVPETEKILIADFALQNILGGQSPNLTGGVRGNLLFPENRSLNYLFYKIGSGKGEDLLKQARTKLEYKSQTLDVALGDIYGVDLKHGGGKGIEAFFRPDTRMSFHAFGTADPYRPIRNVGVSAEEHLSPMRLSSRYTFTENRLYDVQSHIVHGRARMRFPGNHMLTLGAGVSQADYAALDQEQIGFGLNLDYNGRIDNTVLMFREMFGSSKFYGSSAGRHNLVGRIFHPLNNTMSLELGVLDQKYKPVFESAQGFETSYFQEDRRINLELRRVLDNRLIVYGGPVYERKSTNSYRIYNQNPFTTQSSKINIGMRISDGLYNVINPSATLGVSFVTDYSVPDPNAFNFEFPEFQKQLFNGQFSVNFRSRIWGAYLNYFYGPYTVNQELNEFYFKLSTHSIRLMPYVDKYLYKDVIKLSSRLGILHDFSFKTSRTNLSTQLDFFMKHDFTLSLLNSYSYQVTKDLLTEESYKYSNNYFEIRLTKEFNWNQPRVKYYDLTLDLYKDLNGNLSRDFNEPGVRDVLVSIESIDPNRYEDYGVTKPGSSTLVATRLITSNEGFVRYENLVQGLYKISLQNIGKEQGKFLPDQNEFVIHHTKDQTIFVPYLERNKVYGKVVMNRSKLTNLGRIDIANLRITAVDSKGRSMSTLTDANGYWEMYVPSVDNYVVSINNIYADHFNLRQNNYRVSLNGFKQFEVNFIFDEIRRQIEFTPSFAAADAEVFRVGRTNLSGTVRDAATLQALRAQVEVVDNNTSTPIERTNTDRNTGRFNTSFTTNDNYSLIVSAPGYWMYTDRLALEQMLTIQDVDRDILLESIVVGSRFELTNMRFAAGSADIPTEALPELDRIITQLKQNPTVRIRVAGHSDALETLSNRNLSLERANNVVRYMIENGFSNIEFSGLEDKQPVVPNDTPENRQRNRRVEIVIIDR